MPNTQPPPRQPLSLLMHLKVPQWVGLVVLALLVPSGLWMGLGDSRSLPPSAPTPIPAPQVPLQESTPTGALPTLAAILPGKLPSPGPNQKRSGTCDPERAQVELSGGCWVETKTRPPCPRGKQWEHDGRCWLPVADAKPVPTTGEPRPFPVAGPAD